MFDNITIFYNDAEVHLNYLFTNFYKAFKILKKRIKNGENLAQNYAFLGKLYFLNCDNKNALKYILKAKHIDSDYYYANVILTDIYIDENKYFKAKNALDDLLEKAPDNYYSKYRLAVKYYSYIDNENIAEDYLDKLIKLDIKDNPDYYKSLALANFYLIDCNKKEASEYFKKYINEIFPHIDLDALWLLLYSNIFTVFVYVLLAINPILCLLNNCDALLTKAEFLKDQEEYDEAVKVYKSIIKLNNSYFQCYKKIAEIYVIKEDYTSALEYLNLAILNNQNDESLYYVKVTILNKLKRYKESIKTIEKLEKINPQSKNLHYIYSMTQSLIGEHKQALLNINKQLIKEKDVYNYSQKFRCLYNLDMYDEIIKTYNTAENIDEDGVCNFWMACCYEEKQDYKEALKFINKSILLDKGDMYSFYHQSKIFSALGKFEEAEKAYKKAIECGWVDG